MSVYLIEGEILQDIADAVREKKGSTEAILTENMASEIRGIGGGSTGGVNKLAQVVNKSVIEITEADLQGATQIGKYAFGDCTALEAVTLSDEVTSIGENAFTGCRVLSSIHIPAKVKKLNNYSFRGCAALSSVTFAEDSVLNEIAGQVFDGCAFPSVTIPAAVTKIGLWAFQNNKNLKSVVVKPTTPPTINQSFYGISADCVFTVPRGCGDAYKSATNWAALAGQIVEEGGGDAEDDWLFQNEQVDSNGRDDLPPPVDGISYTLFIDGEEICTSTATDYGGGDIYLDFSTEDYRIWFKYQGGAWHFHPFDSQVQSGSVSIRINE